MSLSETEYFVIIGAQRSGTTYLYSQLDDHPEITMARPMRPEPKFFLDEHARELGREHYTKAFFSHRTDERVLGEKSTSYIEHPEVAKRMAAVLPDAKILVMLRNPVQRAISNYYFSVKHGLETRTIEEVFLEKKPAPESTINTSVSAFSYLERGAYDNYLEPFYNQFGADRMKVLLFEKMVGHQAEIQDLYRFLGVDDQHESAVVSDRINSGDAREVVDSKIIESLQEYYIPFNFRLEKRLGIDLSPWQE